MQKGVRWVLPTIVVALVCLDARAALAQGTPPPVRDGIRPTVTAGVVYDDNIFASPDPIADVMLRVSPMISATKTAPKRSLSGSYTFDAERYDHYEELNDIAARQAALFTAAFRPSLRRSYTLTSGYINTNNPIELNPLTSLSAGRRPSDRLDFGTAFHQDMTRTATFDAAYLGNRDKYGTSVTYTNGVDLRLGRRLNPHSDIYVRGNARRFDFGSLGGIAYSNQVAGGWEFRGRGSQFTVDGGAASTDGQISGTAGVSLMRSVGTSAISARYDKGTTTAVGLPGAVEYDHVEFGFSHTPRLRTSTGLPRGVRFNVHGGGSRNVSAFGVTEAFSWGAEISRPFTKTMIFLMTYEGLMQDTVQGSVERLGGDIQRSRVAVSVQFSPWSAR